MTKFRSFGPIFIPSDPKKEVPAYVKRMEVEEKELAERIGKLEKFLNEHKTELNLQERYLMKKQLSAMQDYWQFLSLRIGYARLKKEG